VQWFKSTGKFHSSRRIKVHTASLSKADHLWHTSCNAATLIFA
jgi:hypothetical protein